MDTTADPFQPTKELVLSLLKATNKIIERLKEHNSVNKVLEDWHEDMLNHLAAEVWLNGGRMFELFKQMELNLSTLAYTVRNLLELNVWIEYTCKSKTNARRFYEDKYRDGLGLAKALRGLINAVPNVPIVGIAELESQISRLEKTIRDNAVLAGMTSVDDDFKRVVKAADELGSKEGFIAFNSLLSKFAHPTAFAALSFITGDVLRQLFILLFGIGLVLVIAACSNLRDYVASLGIDIT